MDYSKELKHIQQEIVVLPLSKHKDEISIMNLLIPV